MRILNRAIEGYLGRSSLAIATNGYIGVVVQSIRRGGHGGSNRHKRDVEEKEIIKQKVAFKPYDDIEEIMLFAMII